MVTHLWTCTLEHTCVFDWTYYFKVYKFLKDYVARVIHVPQGAHVSHDGIRPWRGCMLNKINVFSKMNMLSWTRRHYLFMWRMRRKKKKIRTQLILKFLVRIQNFFHRLTYLASWSDGLLEEDIPGNLSLIHLPVKCGRGAACLVAWLGGRLLQP